MTAQGQVTYREIEALLEFLQASGVDGLLEETPVDRFALREEPVRAPQGVPLGRIQSGPAAGQPMPGANAGQMPPQNVSRGPRPGQPAPAQQFASPSARPNTPPAASSLDGAVIPGEGAVNFAREAASSAATLEALRECLAGFTGCNLRLTAKSLVFADGNPEARVMFVGEAPGRDEDLRGLPFVGRSGHLLDLMLTAIGLDRTSAYIANVVPWRPPGNRTPTPQETEICKPFIARQIELADPDILVFLGAASAKALLGVQDGIRRLRGRWMTYDTGKRQVRCIATYHPAYLLRNPIEKRLSWRDFLSIREALQKS